MGKDKTIALRELSKFGNVQDLNEQAVALVNQQSSQWELAKSNYNALQEVKSNTYFFDPFKIVTQYNPERIRSSAAKTDAKSIAERPCFLCTKNLPKEQEGLLFNEKYLILTNPFPIFTRHLTISKLDHIPQQIENHVSDLLDLSRELYGFTVFYNGPECGASAPDHFHFQAGSRGWLPIEEEYKVLAKNPDFLFRTNNTKIFAGKNYLRRVLVLSSVDKNEVLRHFNRIYHILSKGRQKEPMLNILCFFENKMWNLIIFPRDKQRPSHFFETGEEQIVVGPAAVELGGILVLPREADFLKITKKEIQEIYEEVTINNRDFENLIRQLKNE